MVDLYEPSMSDQGLAVQIRSAGAVKVLADPALLHRVIANLLDNELKHLPASCTVWLSLQSEREMGTLTVEDNGPGFDVEISHHPFRTQSQRAHFARARNGTCLC